MSKESPPGFCWLYGPQESIGVPFLSRVRGGEYIHLYLWIMKDMSWLQSWYYAGNIFASLTVVWSGFLITRAVLLKNSNEVIIYTAQLLWLMGNLWWMVGELHDVRYPSQPAQDPEHTLQSGYILQSAMCLLAFYYLIFLPFRFFPPSQAALDRFNETNIPLPINFFGATWRDYENVHILFWAGKDTAWNLQNKAMWIIFAIPTVAIALHFVVETAYHKNLFVDHIHYLAQFLWVSANLVWAYGEIFQPLGDYDDPIPFHQTDSDAYRDLRWWSSWVLFGACVPLALLYIVWIPLTFGGHLDDTDADDDENKYLDNTPSGLSESLVARTPSANLSPASPAAESSTALVARGPPMIEGPTNPRVASQSSS